MRRKGGEESWDSVVHEDNHIERKGPERGKSQGSEFKERNDRSDATAAACKMNMS